jgi:O-antigen/teichoic acid export membrane protein
VNAPARSSAKHTAMRGSFWTLGGYGVSQVIRLLSSLILARMLFPEAFGLMALVNVFMQGLEMLSDIGLGPSIIQNRRGTELRFLRTAWTIQILRGACLWLVSCALARPAAAFFSANDPLADQLAVVLPIAGLMALIGGFSSTALYTLNRRMELRKLTVMTLLPQIVTLLVCIGWAMADRSVWAIVAGGLAGSLTRMVLSHLLNDGPRDRIGWDRDCARELEQFGRWVFFSTVVSFLAGNLDRMVLGRLLSLGELGLYSIGMTFARVATQVSTRLTNTVIFPLLSRYQDNPGRLLVFASRARAAVLWAGGALCSGFALFAPTFFETLYDERYAGAGRISQWLSLYIWTWILNATIDRIPLALGRPRALFVANLAGAFGMVLAWSGHRIAGLPGFIVGMSLSNVAAHGCLQFALPRPRAPLAWQSLRATLAVAAYTLPAAMLLRALGPRLPPWPAGLAAALAAGLPLAAAVLVVRRMMARPSTPPDWERLAHDVSAGVVPFDTLRARGADVLIARATGPDGAPVIVKLWNRPGWRGALRRLAGATIARREWEALRRLRTAGLGAPEPIACLSLTRPDARHTDALIEEDLGACRDATEAYKAMLREGRTAEADAFEEALLHATAAMCARGLIDTDHRLPNFVLRPDGRPVRLDFELCRPGRPALHPRLAGRMLGALLGSYVFAVQPDIGRARRFAARLRARLRPSATVRRVAAQRVAGMLERQRREIGLDTRFDDPWSEREPRP